MAVKDKKFYWLKLKTEFMTGEVIDFLMSQKNGANYVVLYQMICIKTINTQGELATKIGDILVPFDIDKIQRDCKWFDKDTIIVAMELYKKLGLLYEQENGIIKIADFENIIESETYWATSKRLQRQAIELNLKKDNSVGYVYLVKLDTDYKIGISLKPKTRLKEFTQLPYPLEEIYIEKVNNYKEAENELHKHFVNKHSRGEWFTLDENDVEYIKKYLQERKA